MNKELNYLKKSFFSNFKLDIVIFENNQQEAVNNLIQSYEVLHNEFVQSATKKDFTNTLYKLADLFYKVEAEHIEKYGKKQPTGIYYELLYICQESPLRSPEAWLKKIKKEFKANQKKENNIYHKFKNFFAIHEMLSDKEMQNLLTLPVCLNNEVKKLSEQLIKKYNLSYINLTDCPSISTSLWFLQKFDRQASQLVKDINILPTNIGMDNRVSIGYSRDRGFKGFYRRESRGISFSNLGMNKRTILHEWTHALDNYICEVATGQNILLLDINHKTPYQNSSLSGAFNILINLIHKISYDNSEEMSKNSKVIPKPSKYLYNSSKYNMYDFAVGIKKGYYSNRSEMLARYFESQIYNISTKVQDMTSITSRYTTKDPEFEEIKTNLLNNVFNNNLTVDKVKVLSKK